MVGDGGLLVDEGKRNDGGCFFGEFFGWENPVRWLGDFNVGEDGVLFDFSEELVLGSGMSFVVAKGDVVDYDLGPRYVVRYNGARSAGR